MAAGLATATGSEGAPLFCADAIADPLTGLHAAVAALRSWREGGGVLLDLALRDVVAHALCFERRQPRCTVQRARDGWRVSCGAESQRVLEPRARIARGSARPLGCDTRALLRDLAVAC